jgi:hemerythrin superfamily protein
MGKFTEVASKAVGKARQAAAAITGEHGIFNRLKGEHQEVSMLMNRCASTDTSESGVMERVNLYEKVRAELLAHATAEEEVFYSALEQMAETKDLALTSREQHDRVERILMELDSLAADEPAWIERFHALVHEVEAHVREEEDRLFPVAEKAISKQQARLLDERFHARKTRHMESLFPAA